MSELQDAIRLANKMLDRNWADPDSDLALLSRQFLRSREREELAKTCLTRLMAMLAGDDPEFAELIVECRDAKNKGGAS